MAIASIGRVVELEPDRAAITAALEDLLHLVSGPSPCRLTERALSCAPPVKGDDTSGGRPANRAPVRPPDGWRARQAEQWRRVSCSALLGGNSAQPKLSQNL